MFIRSIIYFVIFFISCFYGCKTNYPPIENNNGNQVRTVQGLYNYIAEMKHNVSLFSANNTRIPLTQNQKKNCSGGSIFTSHVTLKCCEEIDGCLYNVISVLMLIVIFLIIFGVFMLCGNWTSGNTDDNKNKKHNKKNNQEE